MTDDTMDDVDHTNPYTGGAFGDAVAFRRGAVAADGGERSNGARPSSDRSDGGERGDGGDSDTDRQTMKEVSHTAPTDDGPQRAFERGTEGRTDTV
jgi:hypothetical protein